MQAARCAPYEAAFRAGVEHLVPTAVERTVAEGIATPKPTRVAEVLRVVRRSGGSIVAVEEAEIVEALRGLARRGLYVEPTSAVAAAGLTRLLADGTIRPHEHTVLCLRLQRGCGVRSWGRDGLGTGARGRGARARRVLAVCAPPALVTPLAKTPLRGPALPEVHARRCPYCRSERVPPVGRVIVLGEAIKAEHRCEACRTAFLIIETMIS